MKLISIVKLYLISIITFNYCTFGDCQVLEGLKDAVLKAEGVFTDIFSSLDSVIKHVKITQDAWKDSVEEDCRFSCPNGNKPKKNKYHKPSTNGCGVPGIEINLEALPIKDLTKCCDVHDICYGTCNRDKDECDLEFKKCLYKMCDKTGLNDPLLTGCKTAAKALYSGTMMFGCKFYKEAQKEACYCGSGKYPSEEF